METQDNRYKNVGAWFIGPKGENGELFRRLVDKSLKEHMNHRLEHYEKEDEAYITDEIKSSDEYKDQIGNIERVQDELIEKLHGSVPFYTPRYQAHMLWDNVIPGLIGYITAMLYNQNNVATEASPATSAMEKEVGQDLCALLGFDKNRSWGHITADGSIANLESMWAARNTKYYPLAVKEALKNEFDGKETLNINLSNGETSDIKKAELWQLLNMKVEDILKLQNDMTELCKKKNTDISEIMAKYQVQNKGLLQYARVYPEMNTPKIFAPATNHYSWPKAATVLGLGKDCVEGIEVDKNCCMRTDLLEEKLKDCLKNQIPVIMVVGVVGSTEEGAVDNVSEILAIRKRMQEIGLSFHVHCDAAWGGYLKTMMVDAEKKEDLLRATRFVPTIPMSQYAREQYMAMANVDTITIDPHKAGFIPYPAGSLCYQEGAMKGMVTFKADYIHSNDDNDMGTYGLEGSKPGAAAAAVWTAHRAIPLNKEGYGQLLGECAYSAKRYYCQWLTLAEEDDEFEISPLVDLPDTIDISQYKGCEGTEIYNNKEDILKDIKKHIIGKNNEQINEDPVALALLSEIGTDVLINSFIVNFKTEGKWNTDAEKMNELNHKLFEMFSISDEETALKDTVPYMLMMTSLDTTTYQAALSHMHEKWGIDFSTVSKVNCLVNTVMNPWTTSYGMLEKLTGIFKEGVKKCITEMNC